ncbi:tetratricopeptide repeat-containing sensor histidine kinase [Fulvivirga sp. 29W222]|uniref:histidine kinase n=1 Tax=Fulvivirga marina TaxID=2494733 RepID=A0A937FYT7_9BACT|nr:ATP-binding protein [Fulvivirga marina]MBL6445421.1 tetratricopeptide repeat-containing sensor histidine kinase [Fulvivirga marina]
MKYTLIILLLSTSWLLAQERPPLPGMESIRPLASDPDDTTGFYKLAHAIEANHDKYPTHLEAYYYYHLGQYYSMHEINLRKAVDNLMLTLAYLPNLPDSLKYLEFKTLRSLGIHYGALSKFDSAAWAYEQALNFINSVNTEKYNSKQAMLYIQLSDLAIQGFGNLELSLEYLDRASKFRDISSDTSEIDYHLASGYGRYHFNKANYDLAKSYFLECLKLAELRNPRERRNIKNFSYSFLASINFEVDNYREALKYDLLSLEIEKEENNPANLIASYSNLGEDYLLIGQPDSALYYYSLGLDLAEKIESAERKIEVLGNLHEFYAQQNDMSRAYSTLKERSELLDTLIRHKTQVRYNELLRKYEAEKQEKVLKEQQDQIELLQAQEEAAQLRLMLFITVIVIGLVIAFFIFRSRIKSREMKAKQLEEMSQFKDAVTGMVAHDLKNPLSVILKKQDNDETVKYMAGKMLTLVQNMLDIRKFEQAQLIPDTEAHSLDKIIQDAEDQVRPLLAEKNINIKANLNPCMVNADKELISRVFINLFTNAIKYSPLNGRILITTEKHSDQITVSITDQGKGISKENLNVIFEPYKQVSPLASGNIASTGLGLTFCKLALEAHHSQIRVESSPGKGTTFTFDLQLAGTNTRETAAEVVDQSMALTAKEKSYVAEILPQLQTLKFHNALLLDNIMDEVEKRDLNNLKPIITALSNAAFSDNRQHYDQLLEELKQLSL